MQLRDQSKVLTYAHVFGRSRVKSRRVDPKSLCRLVGPVAPSHAKGTL
jgi:hypothetical protein